MDILKRICAWCFCWGIMICMLHGQQPNVVLILADDLSYRDLSCFGQTRYQTPHLDRLAQEGVRFTQAYAAAPECAPSRATLMTGLHTGHASIRMNSSVRGQEPLLPQDVTLAKALQTVGYHTGFVGKWGMGLPGSTGVPYQQGFDYSFGFYDQSRAHTYLPAFLWKNDQKVLYPENQGFEMFRRYDYQGNQPQNTYDETGKLYVSELRDPYGYSFAQDEVERASFEFLSAYHPKTTQQPFFLYFATQLPHGPVIIDELGTMAQPDSVNQLSREWAAMVMRLDAYVGNLIDWLEQEGLYEQTVILFASDNGYSMCGYTERGNGPSWPDDPWLQNKGPFSGGKFSVLEGGCRIPFFIHDPRLPASRVVSTPVWLPDVFPTIMDLVGNSQKQYATDGQSLLPLMQGNPSSFPQNRALYFSRGSEQAVRMGPWKAYRSSPSKPTRLYLVEEDSYTERNLAQIYPDIVGQMEQVMDTSWTPHSWYRNPNESHTAYRAKRKKAEEEGERFPVFHPNGISQFPWELKQRP